MAEATSAARRAAKAVGNGVGQGDTRPSQRRYALDRARGGRGERNGAYRTGRYSAAAKADRRLQRALIRELRWLTATSGIRPRTHR